MKFQSDAQKESYDDFPQVTCFECNSGVCKKANFLRSYLRQYRAKSSEIRTQHSAPILIKWGFCVNSETSQKKVIAKMPRWLVRSRETLESKALIPNVMKPAHKKIEKRDQRLQNKPLRGGNLLYIKKMNNSWMIQMTILLSIYRILRGHSIIRTDITIIM